MMQCDRAPPPPSGKRELVRPGPGSERRFVRKVMAALLPLTPDLSVDMHHQSHCIFTV